MQAELIEILSKKRPVIFLDYDGTLTPIVDRPEDALLPDDMKKLLQDLAGLFTVAIVTGRDKEDVEKLVGIDDLIYAGSHGYIISGPEGIFMEHPQTAKIVPRLDAIENEVCELLRGHTKGVQIDRKRYAIGIHYRNARQQDKKLVYDAVSSVLRAHTGFKTGEGKMILEIKPDLPWDKGRAVLWILDVLGLKDDPEHIPVFIGDDLTDEDAFRVLSGTGVGILVGHHGESTHASFRLENVQEVKNLFRQLLEIHRPRGK